MALARSHASEANLSLHPRRPRPLGTGPPFQYQAAVPAAVAAPPSVAPEGGRKWARLHRGWRRYRESAGTLFGASPAWPGPSAGHWARPQVPARDAARRGTPHGEEQLLGFTSTRPIWMVRVAAGRLRLCLAAAWSGTDNARQAPKGHVLLRVLSKVVVTHRQGACAIRARGRWRGRGGSG